MVNSSSFTLKSVGGVLNVLKTACGITESRDPATLGPPKLHEFQAIWDTGATNSVITQKVVDTCHLRPIGMTQVHGVNSTDLCEVFLVDVHLLNNVAINQVRVTKGRLAGDVDVLIGMDIISVGDFVITNQGGVTIFSFCAPSHRRIDFVEEHNEALKASRPGFRGYKPPKPPSGGNRKKHRS
jgi:hypothetical protein